MDEKIRADFPILNDIIYLDSAATSLTPEPVLEAVLSYYREYNANVGRSVHRLSQFATQKYQNAHRKVAEFIGANHQGEVIFTKNTTEATNMVAYGLRWEKGDEVVTTLLEHHSNFLPWLRLREKGVILKIVEPTKEGIFDIADFEQAIGARTKLVAMTHVSNVLGTISPVKEIAAICKDKGSDTLFLVDGAQSAPHIPLNVEELGCDFFAFSGHKMLGPTGTGVLWLKDPNGLQPTLFGGGMIESVSQDEYTLAEGYERFEAGTPHIAGGIGLGRAVDYLNDLGMERIREYEERLAKRLLEGLLDIDKVQVYGTTDPNERLGVVSFTIEGIHPHELAVMLDEAADIMVRSGHHCCMPLMTYLGLKQGTVRASLYLYNTKEEIATFLETVEGIAKVV
ncbi:MAG TPA: cysteine desulfurase [Desulfobacteria bacterium]|nr:cysteine desulfurase [Desulfobacteria bacterium]